MKTRLTPLLVAALALPLLSPGEVRAAESLDNCSGFITSLPAVISGQGTWCFIGDLSTALASGSAISVTANNVIIDCNDFKLGGLAAGPATQTTGIGAVDRANVTVRHCNVRGFRYGVSISGSGHLVEDNRMEGNTERGIVLVGDGSTVRRNQVFDTGGSTVGTGLAIGIQQRGSSDVLDNTVNVVTARPASGQVAYGILADDDGAPAEALVAGNRVRRVLPDGAALGVAIRSVVTGRTVVLDNALFGLGAGIGIQCATNTGIVRGNAVLAFASAIPGCSSDGGNVVKP